MTILDDIAVYKRREIAEARKRVPLEKLTALARAADRPRGFLAALKRTRAAGRFALIAEIKKASPSKGLIRADFDPPALARAYESGGASCLSVLTDAPSFQGAPEFLGQARRAASLPVLRKDFMFEPYQAVEARAWGADCILIIMASVTDEEAKALVAAAREWMLDVLVEVHNEGELDRALTLGVEMIGINNRDLHNFITDLAVTRRLVPRIPKDKFVIAESGISSRDDLLTLSELGVGAFLVGESLMRQADVSAATRMLLGG